MAAAVSLAFLVLIALSFAILFRKTVAQMLPFSAFYTILFLYFFYCADLLVLGRSVFLLVNLCLAAYAAYRFVTQKIPLGQILSPALVIFF